VKQLRDETGTGMMDCKNALSESDWTLSKHKISLGKKVSRVQTRKQPEKLPKEG